MVREEESFVEVPDYTDLDEGEGSSVAGSFQVVEGHQKLAEAEDMESGREVEEIGLGVDRRVVGENLQGDVSTVI